MNDNFPWPKAAYLLLSEAERGALKRREMFPIEIAALASLASGALLNGNKRAIAPELIGKRRDERRGEHYLEEVRAVYEFMKPLSNDRLWRARLTTRWIEARKPLAEIAGCTCLRSRNTENSETWIEECAK